MSALAIVKAEIRFEAGLDRRQGLVVLEIDVFILDGAPQPFDEDVVRGPSPAVHADPKRMRLQGVKEDVAGELRALIRVENLRDPKPTHRFLEAVHTEPCVRRIAQPPGQDLPTIPVQNRHQVAEALSQSDVGDIGTPHLIGALDGQPPQQVGVDRMRRMGLAGVGTGSHPRQPQLLHQAPHSLAVDRQPAVPQKRHHPPAAKERMAGVFFINQPQHQQILVIDRFRSSMRVVGRPPDPRQGALPGQG